MSTTVLIPIFPLAIIPLPGELVPLHIFEPRYRQLLHEAETNDIRFGIYFTHSMNEQKIGALMKLESIIKRYPGGESDIIARCLKGFTVETLHETLGDKLYPGGQVSFRNFDVIRKPADALYNAFIRYMSLRNITRHASQVGNIFEIAGELSLNVAERYKLLTATRAQQEVILFNRLRFLIHVAEQEMKSKDVFHLN